jgi:DNA-binding MarR family transcriptional regulator
LSTPPDRHATIPPDPRTAWHQMLRLSSHVLRALDDALDTDHRMSVNDFDVLITLDNAPGRRLRMTDLARATMLSSGGMTRLVGRLEARGLVRRDPDSDDARAYQASLTRSGAAMLARARVTHDAVLSSVIAPHVGARELQELERVLGKVLTGNRLGA